MDSNLKSRKVKFRSPAVLMVIGGAATLVLALGVVMVLLLTGDDKSVSDNAAVIGALVALGGVFTAQLVNIALEAQRAHEAALQNYFEQVGTLLIEQPLRRASSGDNLSTVVRAQTLSLLEGLDPDRTRILLQFLYEAALIHKDKPVVSLLGAHLIDANLRRATLGETYLSGANLSGANLNEAILSGADLSGADLSGANLSEAVLNGAVLSGANLSGTNLRGASLREARLSEARLSDALVALLVGANPSEADLHRAQRLETDLSGADLSEADLSGVVGITNEELERQVSSLEGATMPDGQKYEDWLKDKEGSGKNVENE
jgi:uncharacterized protein YjbI with pentapeptide repeats